MSPLTIFLGRFFGLSCLVMCAALFARPKESPKAIESMKESPGLVLVTGILTMVGGVAAVDGHNVRSGGALPVAVTLLGWVTLIKGVALDRGATTCVDHVLPGAVLSGVGPRLHGRGLRVQRLADGDRIPDLNEMTRRVPARSPCD